jgi:adenylate kinase
MVTTSRWKQVLFLGPPGVGKGTYARRVAPLLGFGHVSPGDLLRASVASQPELEAFLKKGTLVPESVVFKLVSDKLEELQKRGAPGVILDGFPRSRDQAAGWLKNARAPDLVVDFHLPEELLVQKLLGRRTCSVCGDLYNIFSFSDGEYSMPAMMPIREGRCDKCGGDLVERIDDTLDVIRERLRNHRNTEKDLVDYVGKHCGSLESFKVKTGIAQLNDLLGLIKRKLEIL